MLLSRFIPQTCYRFGGRSELNGGTTQQRAAPPRRSRSRWSHRRWNQPEKQVQRKGTRTGTRTGTKGHRAAKADAFPERVSPGHHRRRGTAAGARTRRRLGCLP